MGDNKEGKVFEAINKHFIIPLNSFASRNTDNGPGRKGRRRRKSQLNGGNSKLV